MTLFNNIVLALSGLALLYMSTMRLFDPSAVVFLQGIADTSGILTIEMANEIRAMGAENVLGGIVAFLGIAIKRFRLSSSMSSPVTSLAGKCPHRRMPRWCWMFTAFAVLSVMFVGASLGRSVSLVVDGVPDKNIFRAFHHQALLGALNVLCLIFLLREGKKL